MNGVMTGMALVMVFWMRVDARAADPLHGDFWLMMSASLIAEAIVAYPFNWWLVARKLKHGRMSTVVKGVSQGQHMASHGMHESRHDDGSATPQGHMSTPMPGGRDQFRVDARCIVRDHALSQQKPYRTASPCPPSILHCTHGHPRA